MYLLLQMGFPREAIKRALFYTSNQGLESATKWLIEHITDNNYADPFVPSRRDFNNGKDGLINFDKQILHKPPLILISKINYTNFNLINISTKIIFFLFCIL